LRGILGDTKVCWCANGSKGIHNIHHGIYQVHSKIVVTNLLIWVNSNSNGSSQNFQNCNDPNNQLDKWYNNTTTYLYNMLDYLTNTTIFCPRNN
jgi:hypothetical protein